MSVARTATPFQGADSGVSHIGKASFGGTADALALDVKGKIGGLRFAKGLGSPVSNSNIPANYGIPYANTGYPANGLMGAMLTASSIGHVNIGNSSTILLQSNNPNLQQSSPGFNLYFPTPGAALSSVAITTTGSIGSIRHRLVTRTSSEIKTGFNLNSFAAGFSGQTGKSHIGKVKINGNLINSVVSASYTPASGIYGSPGSSKGPGKITGRLNGSTSTTAHLPCSGTRCRVLRQTQEGLPRELSSSGKATATRKRRRKGNLPRLFSYSFETVSSLPAPLYAVPDQAGSETGSEKQIAARDLTVFDKLIERDRNRPAGGVAESLEVAINRPHAGSRERRWPSE